MKKFVLILVLSSITQCAFAFYDFCETPQEYNTFPPAYDIKTEYWKNIPKYNTDNVKYQNINHNKNSNRTIIRQEPTIKQNYSEKE
jgi:hypothetical protein